jgi:hypothetical protein
MAWLRTVVKLLLSILLACALSSCQASDDAMGLDVTGYNHTDKDIGFFSVDGQGGSFVIRHGQGGFSCCVSIPSKYTTGMTVTVRWGGEEIGKTQERVVAVPPYRPEDGAIFAVHFLRDGEIKVFVTMYLLGYPKYPLKADEAKL